MRETKYAIIDIETTGGQANRSRITEIAVVLHDGKKVIETFETLINPECYIPYGITELTGITQEMVMEAPKFYEVAKEIVKMTEGAVFVAHNVRFDYTFIKEEFARLGYTYTRKQLCTVRLSRKVFPGLPSYSLENLIHHFGIKVTERHRAMADAMATAELFDIILAAHNNLEHVHHLVNLGIKESRLPSNLNLEKIHQLPEQCGVYYFHNEKGEVVYVGKSINIRKRVAEHFADQSAKAAKLQQLVHDITFELTGSELAALLLESHEIKRLMPSVNRAQRRRLFPYVIHSHKDASGYLCFSIAQVNTVERRQLHVLSEYPKVGHARSRLAAAVKHFELCPCLCSMQAGRGPCFSYHLKQCRGACIAEESPESYNTRAEQARQTLSLAFENSFFILDQGRTPEEWAVILVENGGFNGLGYIDRSDWDGNTGQLRDCLRDYLSNAETTRIILRHLSQHPSIKTIPIQEKASGARSRRP